MSHRRNQNDIYNNDNGLKKKVKEKKHKLVKTLNYV